MTDVEIIYRNDIDGGGVLHRFTDCFGVPCSAIYIFDIEIWRCERDDEAQMIADWNEYTRLEKKYN